MSEPQYLEFEIHSYSQTVRVPYWPGGEMEKLYAQFKADESMEAFDALCDWARDDIQDRIEFDIENVR